jgi:protein-disulfide isomerase
MKSRQLMMIVAAVVVVAAAGLWYYFNLPQPSPLPGGSAATAVVGDDLMTAGPLGERALGDPKAPNVVIEYASLTCSHCQAFHEQTFEAFKTKYIDTGKVYFIMREFPLDLVAKSAVMLARCAPPEQYFPMVDLFFEKQREWAFSQNPADSLRNLVRQAGIGEDAFRACLNNKEIADGVEWVKNRGANEFDVTATPTFFVNGKKMSGALSITDLDAALGG